MASFFTIVVPPRSHKYVQTASSLTTQRQPPAFIVPHEGVLMRDMPLLNFFSSIFSSPAQALNGADMHWVFIIKLKDGYHSDLRVNDEYHLPRSLAEQYLQDAPLPYHSQPHGPRPHAHLDIEELFQEEMEGLQPLDTARDGERQPALWAYPALWYNWQKHLEKMMKGKKDHQDTSPVRIVTDRAKNIIGVAYHTKDDQGGFVRAEERLMIKCSGGEGGEGGAIQPQRDLLSKFRSCCSLPILLIFIFILSLLYLAPWLVGR